MALQDRFGLDVNLLLAALWSAEQGRVWTPSCCAELERASAVARDEVVRLRARRRAVERGTPVYAALLEEELVAEARVQDAMYEVLRAGDVPAREGSFAARAEACLEVVVGDERGDAACEEALRRLVQAVVHGLDERLDA